MTLHLRIICYICIIYLNFEILQPTALHLVPPLIQFLAYSPEVKPEDLETVHTIIGAAAPIGAGLIHKLLDKAGKYIFFQEGYGKQ